MLRTGMWVVVVWLLAALLAGCSSGPSGQVLSRGALPAPDSTSTDGAYKGTSQYRLGAQDLLEVSVFGLPDLNQTVRVNSDGQISLPLVGAVQAGGQSIPALEAELAKRFVAGGFVRNPQVTVFVKEFVSQRVTVEGAVKKPGIYPLTGKTTLLQALAVAGGLEQLADLKGVVLFREVDGKKMAAAYDMRELRKGNITDPQLYGDDMIVVEQSGSKTALRGFIEAVPAFGRLFLAF